MAKLVEADVLEIRRLHAAGKLTQRTLAGMFGVSFGMINNIVLRKAWAHI
jgi:hypothetical protein